MVTGSGRSGTSSVAGTLKRFGFVIPQPEVKADERNPRGYYEPSWVARFHGKWMKALPIRTIDARPHAGDVAMDDLTPEREEVLREWLASELALLPQNGVMVIKDTRAFWVYPLWARVVEQAGAEMVSLTMLRHPTQVVRSRDAAWLTGQSESKRVQRETANVAAWMNSVFITERSTRGNARAFVPYYDLIGDWRAAMTRACEQLGVDPGSLDSPHVVDEFITPTLNRSGDSWDGLTVPKYLSDLAERTWVAANSLVVDPYDAGAIAILDGLSAEYEELYDAAVAMASDEIDARILEHKREMKARLDRKNELISTLRDRLRAR